MYIYLEREKFLETIEKKRRRIFRWSKNISRKWNCAKACLLIASIDKTTAIGAALAENGMEIRESWISASCLRPLLHTLWKKNVRLLYASHTCLPFSPPCFVPFAVSSPCMHLSRLSTSFLFFFFLFFFAHSRREFSHLEADTIGGASTV